MNAVFQTDFERTENTDEIHGVFGRILVLSSRFDGACKALARLPNLKSSISMKNMITDEQFYRIIESNFSKFKNLNRAIQSIPEYKLGLQDVLDKARDSRNELIHASILGLDKNLDSFENINEFMQSVAGLVRVLIRGDIVISALITEQNSEIVL